MYQKAVHLIYTVASVWYGQEFLLHLYIDFQQVDNTLRGQESPGASFAI